MRLLAAQADAVHGELDEGLERREAGADDGGGDFDVRPGCGGCYCPCGVLTSLTDIIGEGDWEPTGEVVLVHLEESG